MKKSRGSGSRGGSSGRIFRSSPRKSGSGGGLFGSRHRGKSPGMSGGPKVKPSDGSGGKVPGMQGGHKIRDDFQKPPHDPGPKRTEEIAAGYGQTGDTYGEGVQTGSGGGGGCCSIFGNLMTVVVVGIMVVVVIVLLKCINCG